MSKVMLELQKEIKRLEKNLDGLRALADDYDSNHVANQVAVASTIYSCTLQLDCLKRFQQRMVKEGES